MQAVFYCEYRIKKGASILDFLLAAERLNNEYISKQKGYISWKQLNDGNIWADYITFETMEDLQKFEVDSVNAGELAQNFYSYINLISCKVNRFNVKKDYK